MSKILQLVVLFTKSNVYVKVYGKGRWKKVKGVASISFPNGKKCNAEIHWYEAHGIGKKEFKIKYILE